MGRDKLGWEQSVSFFAVLFPSDGSASIEIGSIEGFTTEKSDNGDAGTFQLHAPLTANRKAASAIGPMDMVALFAGRSAVEAISNTPSSLRPSNLKGLTWGDIKTTFTLSQLDGCIFVGMVDKAEEMPFSEGGPATLSINGRDLTKVFIDNDVFVPYTVPNGSEVFSLLSNLVLQRASSGTQLLLNALNVFVKKDPTAIANLAAASDASGQSNFGPGALSQIAQFGFPWDHFVIQNTLDPNFRSFGNSLILPNFSVQSGSAWSNMQDLRNFPLTRLFVDELGRLIFDDAYLAWNGRDQANPTRAIPPILTIAAENVRSIRFSQSDDDVVTALSVMPSLTQMGDVSIATGGGVAVIPSDLKDNTLAIARYGYRWQEFQSQYDGPDHPESVSARFPVLLQLHNSMWRCTLTVKGNPALRVGLSVALMVGGVHPMTRPQTKGALRAWYIESCSHRGGYGDDYTTELELRFPRDYVMG